MAFKDFDVKTRILKAAIIVPKILEVIIAIVL
jgi:hypothetical protein